MGLCLLSPAAGWFLPLARSVRADDGVVLPRKAPLELVPIAKLASASGKENSGIVRSRRWSDVFWAHNDSGDDPRIYPIRSDGTLYASERYPEIPGVLLGGAINVDWEDITLTDDGHLVIADFGNNPNTRRDMVLYILDEPSPTAGRAAIKKKVFIRYPDQREFPPPERARDFDAEAIYAVGNRIHILSKNRGDPMTRLYRLDSQRADETNTLTLLERFDFRGQVTGADASSDGRRLVVVTYDALWLFERQEPDQPFFSGRISWLPFLQEESEVEAVCFEDDHTVRITDEGRGEMYAVPLAAMVVVRQPKDVRWAVGPDAVDVKVMSFNIRYGSADDGEDSWPQRRELLLEAVERFAPDLLGTQEAEHDQVEWLDSRLADYRRHGVGRNDGEQAGEYCAIWFRADRFTLTGSGQFWLSETPDRPGSRGWGAGLPRMVSWVKLWDRPAHRPLQHFNTHFDNQSGEARLQSSRMLRREVEGLDAGLPVVITGDFNMTEDAPGYRTLCAGERPSDSQGVEGHSQRRLLLVDTYRAVRPWRDEYEATFMDFTGRPDGRRIDWILASGPFDVVTAKIDRFQQGGRYPSDHYPVTAVLRYPVLQSPASD
jgi:endonuclease/exonuclease/phosphatase family metal-dependent hydrolase